MKRSLVLLISTAVALVFGACDQDSWDKKSGAQPATKDVFKPHGHGHGGEGHDKDHGGEKKKDH